MEMQSGRRVEFPGGGPSSTPSIDSHGVHASPAFIRTRTQPKFRALREGMRGLEAAGEER